MALMPPEAGLLAPGSTSPRSLPVPSRNSGSLAEDSPVTVAGPHRPLTGFPIEPRRAPRRRFAIRLSLGFYHKRRRTPQAGPAWRAHAPRRSVDESRGDPSRRAVPAGIDGPKFGRRSRPRSPPPRGPWRRTQGLLPANGSGPGLLAPPRADRSASVGDGNRAIWRIENTLHNSEYTL